MTNENFRESAHKFVEWMADYLETIEQYPVKAQVLPGEIKGKFLLIHGTADDNVHFQNTAELIEAMVQKNVDFDLGIYPNKNHGIYGGNTRYHLYSKMNNFILENL